MQSSLQLHKSFKNHGVYCLIFTARFASLLEMSDKQDDFAADLCSIVPAD